MMNTLRRLLRDEYPDHNETWREFMEREERWLRALLMPAGATVLIIVCLLVLAEIVEKAGQ